MKVYTQKTCFQSKQTGHVIAKCDNRMKHKLQSKANDLKDTALVASVSAPGVATWVVDAAKFSNSD